MLDIKDLNRVTRAREEIHQLIDGWRRKFRVKYAPLLVKFA